jgi:hypothetical protein
MRRTIRCNRNITTQDNRNITTQDLEGVFKMNANSPSTDAMEVTADGMTTQFAPNMVIDNLDEFSVGISTCATSSDYAIGSL